MAWNDEDKITWAELAGSLKNLFKSLQSQVTREVMRAKQVEQNLDNKIDAEKARAEAAEWALNSTNPNSINSPSNPNSPLNPNNSSSPLSPLNPNSILNPNNANSPLSPLNPNGILNPNNPSSPISPNNPNGILNPNNSNSPLSPNNPNGILNPNNTNSPLSPNNPNGILNPANSNSPLSPNKPGGMLNPNNSNSPLSPNNSNSPLNPNNPNSPLSPSNPTSPLNPKNPTSPLSPENPDSPLNPDSEDNALGEKMSKLDFCNMAPKIGFYQEDTVSVMPKYNMNHPASGIFITSDASGNEVAYFMADDGGYAKETRFFKAYRTKQTQQFEYDNTIYTPGFCAALNCYITGIHALDNDYIIVNCSNGKCYIVDTQYSYDTSQWINYKDITSIRDNYGWSMIRFFRKWGTIACYSHLNYNLKTRYDSKVLRIFRYSDLTLLKSFKLENEKMYLDLNALYGDRRFYPASDPRHSIHRAADIVDDFNYGHWGGYRFVMLPEKGILCYDHANWFRGDLTYAPGSNSAINSQTRVNVRYNIPESYYYNNTNNNGANINMAEIIIGGSAQARSAWSSNNSYDSYKEVYYRGVNDDNYINNGVHAEKFFMADQGNVAGCFGFTNRDTTGIWYNLTASDASNWGKFLYPFFVVWDHVIMNSQNKQGNHLTYFQECRLIPGQENNHYFEPKPGKYFDVPFANFDPTLLRSDPNGLVFCRQTNNQLLLLYCYYDSTNKRLVAEKVNQVTTSNSFTASREVYRTINFDMATKIPSTHSGYSIDYGACFHNPLGNYWILCFTTVSTGPYNRYPVIFFVNSAGNVTTFNNCYTKFASNAHSDAKTARANDGTNETRWYFRVMNVLSTTFNTFSVYGHLTGVTDTRYSLYYTVEFNSSYNNFTSRNMPRNTTYTWSFSNGWFAQQLYYSGPALGFIHGDNQGYSQVIRSFASQKPFLAYTGSATYSDEQFLFDTTKENRYYFWCRSSTGLRCFVPAIGIFLGGYYSEMESAVEVPLQANTINYIYMERPKDSRYEIDCFSDTRQMIPIGSRQFSRILVAKIITDGEGPTDIEYYHVNTGYNDYMFHHNQYYS